MVQEKMININSNPEEWSSLLYELEDAKEHLESLIAEMNRNGEIHEVEYKIQLGHVFAHLNRGWNTRHKVGEYNEKERAAYPIDLEPCG